MPDNPPEPPPPPPPPPLSPRASNSALPRTPSSKRPSNKQVDVGDGGMLAAIASPDKRPSLKKTQSDDKSSPMIDAEASLRREVPAGLLAEVRRRSSSSLELAEGSVVQTEMDVWVPDDKKVWVKGKVAEQVGRSELLVVTGDGAKVKIDMSITPELFTVNPTLEDDMTSLWHLHEPGILDNLDGRFDQDEPYTNVAHLLIAVNPLKRTPQPEMESISKVRSLTGLKPHPYVIAEMAYRALLLPPNVRQSQSVVVCC